MSGAPPDTGPRRRRWLRVVLTFVIPITAVLIPLALLAGGVLALWSFRLAALEWSIVRLADALDLGPAEVTVERIDTTSVRVSGLRMGPKGRTRIASIDIRHTIEGLLAGRVDLVRVEGLRLSGRLDETGLVIADLEQAFAGDGDGGGATMPVLPAEHLEVVDARIDLDTTFGPIATAVDLELEPRADAALGTNARLRLTLPEGTLAVTAQGVVTEDDRESLVADLRLTAEAAGAVVGTAIGKLRATAGLDGSISGQLELADAHLAHARAEVAGLKGIVDFARSADRVQRIGAELTFEKLDTGELALRPGRVEVALDGAELTAHADLAATEGEIDLDMSGTLGVPAPTLAFAARGAVDASALRRFAPTPGLEGAIAYDLAGTARDPAALRRLRDAPLATWLRHIGLEGIVELDVRGLDWPGMVAGAGIVGRFAVAARDEEVLIDAVEETRLRIENLELDPAAYLPPPLATAFTGPVVIDLEQALALLIALRPDGYDVAVSGGLGFPETPFDLRVQADARVALEPNLQVATIELPFLLLAASGLRGPAGLEEAEIVATDTTWKENRASGQLAAVLRSAGASISGVEASASTIEIDTGFEMDADDLTVRPGAATRATLSGVKLPGSLTLAGPLTISLDAGADNVVRVPLGGDPFAYELALAPIRVAAKLAAETPVDMTAELEGLRLSGGGDAHTLAFEATAELPVYALRLAGIQGRLAVADRKPQGELRISEIAHGHFPPLVVPVRALASLRTEDDHRVTFALELADASGRLALNAEGHHDMTRGSGELRGELKRLTFLPTVLEPSRLFPVLAGKLEEVDGAVDARGRISWDGGEPVSSLDLLVEVKRLTTGEITVENANTIVHFDSLFPPTTPPGQEILVGLIDVGVPMTRGRLLFQLRGDGSVEVELDELLLFGGSIGSEPFRLSPTDPNFAVDLEVSGVQLARILKLAEYGDFSATGLLDGTIPVVVENGEVAIRGGVLETRAGGGTLSYHPKEVGSALTEVDASTALFLDAIENFQYDTIRVSLDEGGAEELVLGLSLKGRNPDVYGGVPFVLNVTITGPLDAILSRGLATYTLPERIRERILEFGD